MEFDDQYSAGVTRDPVEPLLQPIEVLLSAEAVIEQSQVANGIVLLRTRMGFPLETFSMAVRPVIDGYAAHVQLSQVTGAQYQDSPGGQLRSALATVLRAIELRRGHILPRNAAPETLGALAHRWTYAVFVAAFLRDVENAWGLDAISFYERCVPEAIQDWMAEDPALEADLRALLRGSAAHASVIAELVEHAATGVPPVIERAPTTVTPSEVGSDGTDGSAETTTTAADSAAAAPVRAVEVSESDLVRRFMAWIRSGVSEGRLPVNARGALLHRVEEGLLLVSPAIFRAFVRQEGVSKDDTRTAARQLQRELFRAGWHLRAEGGVNLHGYTWRGRSGADGPVHGVVIVEPIRFVDPMPAVNDALVRVVQGAEVPH